MKAAVLEGLRSISYQDVDMPVPAADEVLLQVKAVSICGSDISRYMNGHRMYPLILGHECAGVIVSTGAGVDQSLIGQHAALVPLVPCMACDQCQRGLYSACRNYSFMGSRRSGGFAEYVAAPARCIVTLPKAIGFEAGALIEPSTVALHSMEMGRFAGGQAVAVFGAGSVGLMAVQWARIGRPGQGEGASQTICVDTVDEKLDFAARLGATSVLNPRREDVARRVMELTGDGVDLALEMAGATQAFETALKITRPRGSIVLTGNQPQEAVFPAALLEHVTRQEFGIYGTWMSYSAPFPGHEWTGTIAALLDGSLRTEEMISHRFKLAEVEQVFKQIENRTLVHRKIMLEP